MNFIFYGSVVGQAWVSRLPRCRNGTIAVTINMLLFNILCCAYRAGQYILYNLSFLCVTISPVISCSHVTNYSTEVSYVDLRQTTH